MHSTGQTAAQGGSVQCMQAIDTERSPGLPSLMVTTRWRLIPYGTSFSFLQAVTQALQSMHRSASQRNFIRATTWPPSRELYLAERRFGFLHSSRWIEAIGRQRVHALAKHDRIGPLRIFAAQIDALEPAGEMIWHPREAFADPLCHQRFHARVRAVFGAHDPDPIAVLNAARARVRRIDLDIHVLPKLGEPFIGARLLATSLVIDEATGGENQREFLDDALVDRGFLHREADIRHPELLRVRQRRVFGDEVWPRSEDRFAKHRDGIGQVPSDHARLGVTVWRTAMRDRHALDAAGKVGCP